MNFLSNLTLASLIALFFIYFNQVLQVESTLSLNSFQEFSFIKIGHRCGKFRKCLCCCKGGSTEENEEDVATQNQPDTTNPTDPTDPTDNTGHHNFVFVLDGEDTPNHDRQRDRARSESTPSGNSASSCSSSSSSGSSRTTSSSASSGSDASGSHNAQNEGETPTEDAA
ncbi:hypothetical protein OJ253_2023 [Cryptosporidium canis]|uniref:Uncharacterized protein n=1 Tax=Cryptosporidium canis TaxID=195482 RepID=A0A9D5HXD9_9CRYT|nr:hypothetical protein OJ253_2023 [Cryptosporidium canis]